MSQIDFPARFPETGRRRRGHDSSADRLRAGLALRDARAVHQDAGVHLQRAEHLLRHDLPRVLGRLRPGRADDAGTRASRSKGTRTIR